MSTEFPPKTAEVKAWEIPGVMGVQEVPVQEVPETPSHLKLSPSGIHVPVLSTTAVVPSAVDDQYTGNPVIPEQSAFDQLDAARRVQLYRMDTTPHAPVPAHRAPSTVPPNWNGMDRPTRPDRVPIMKILGTQEQHAHSSIDD